MSNKPKTIAIIASLPVLLLAIFLAVGSNDNPWIAKNAPSDPSVNEAIGQARALLKLGKLTDALIIFEKYAQQGYPDAMFYLAKSYSRGWGTEVDLEKSRKILLEAVQYSFAYRGESAYALGRLFQRSLGENCNTIAVEWFKKALVWNHKKASLQLAYHYERGLGVDIDIEQARQYYEIAIRFGYEQAMIKYARLLIEIQSGASINDQKIQLLIGRAVTSLERKSRSGSANSAKQLGRLYRNGKLLPIDLELAEKWLLHAAKLGSIGAMHDLARLMLHEANQLTKIEEALTWLRIAADQGHGGAMTALGRFHLKKQYGLKQKDAVQWFKKGVAAKHGGAMEELARLHQQGLLVEKDHDEALRLARRGANMGHSGAQRLLNKLLGTEAGLNTALNA